MEQEQYGASQGDPLLTGKDLREADLRFKDLSDYILFGTDLRGADLYGAKIALKCEQVDGCKIDDIQAAKLFLMLSLFDMNPKYQVRLRDMVRAVTGEKHYTALERWLKIV